MWKKWNKNLFLWTSKVTINNTRGVSRLVEAIERINKDTFVSSLIIMYLLYLFSYFPPSKTKEPFCPRGTRSPSPASRINLFGRWFILDGIYRSYRERKTRRFFSRSHSHKFFSHDPLTLMIIAGVSRDFRWTSRAKTEKQSFLSELLGERLVNRFATLRDRMFTN